jgi:hypothetical protein
MKKLIVLAVAVMVLFSMNAFAYRKTEFIGGKQITTDTLSDGTRVTVEIKEYPTKPQKIKKFKPFKPWTPKKP